MTPNTDNPDKPNICKRCGTNHSDLDAETKQLISDHLFELFSDNPDKPQANQGEPLADLLWRVIDRDISVNAAVARIEERYQHQLAERLQKLQKSLIKEVDDLIVAEQEYNPDEPKVLEVLDDVRQELHKLMPKEAS